MMPRPLHFIAALLFLLLASLTPTGCHFGPQAFPKLDGKTYTQEGMASWYGDEFDGRPTANGEKFDMNGLTAAHRTAPFGTWANVTNLDNGKQVRVRINDRGPFVDDRIIDLSKGAARVAGMLGTGTARVRIEFSDSQGRNTALNEANYFVQIGAYKNPKNAWQLISDLRQAFPKLTFFLYSSEYHRVRCGPYNSKDDAQEIAKSLAASRFFSERHLETIVSTEQPRS